MTSRSFIARTLTALSVTICLPDPVLYLIPVLCRLEHPLLHVMLFLDDRIGVPQTMQGLGF